MRCQDILSPDAPPPSPALTPPLPPLQAVAQGRVWTGSAALERKLVDCLGGVATAAALAARAAGIPDNEPYAVVEVSKGRVSPLKLLSRWRCWLGLCFCCCWR